MPGINYGIKISFYLIQFSEWLILLGTGFSIHFNNINLTYIFCFHRVHCHGGHTNLSKTEHFIQEMASWIQHWSFFSLRHLFFSWFVFQLPEELKVKI